MTHNVGFPLPAHNYHICFEDLLHLTIDKWDLKNIAKLEVRG